MKNTVVATLLAISGFAISGFAIASPVNAQTAIVAALYQNPTSPQTEVRYESTKASQNQIILAVNNTPEVQAIAENIIAGTSAAGRSYDRIVTMNHREGLVCLVNSNGSVDGTVMCGFIDHE
jgi:hypothetical protein